MIRFSNVKVIRQHHSILDIDSLHIPVGSFTAITGPNGAGKTTLLQVACGLIKPQCGDVVFNNQHWGKLNNWQKATLRKNIGYVPQVFACNTNLPFSVREVVAMGLTGVTGLLHPLRKQHHQFINKQLARFDLAGKASQLFRNLSGGQQRKALIARAMVSAPSVLLLDEPAANLDTHWKKQLSQTVSNLYKDAKITIIMVSHDRDFLPEACISFLQLQQGRLINRQTDNSQIQKTIHNQQHKPKTATQR